VVLWPVAGSAVATDLASAAILATNSLFLHKAVAVSGDVVGNDASAGPTLYTGFEVNLDRDTRITGNVAGDSVRVDQGGSITGSLAYNNRAGTGTAGSLVTPLALPVFPLLPTFQTANPRDSAADVAVAPLETRVLPAGDYGAVTVALGGTLIFSGGRYDLRSLDAVGTSCNVLPCRSFLAAGPVDIRIVGKLSTGVRARFGPASGSGVANRDVVVYVGGINGTTGALQATPAAVGIGRASSVGATIYAPEGRIAVERESAITGALLARDIDVDQGSTVTVASYFTNRPPTADPQSVLTSGAAPLLVTLTGSDPEGAALSFAIVTPPTQGALGAVTTTSGTSADVTYTPATGGNVPDSFTFSVADPFGATGMAVVRINPDDNPDAPPPPPPTTVVATDVADTGIANRSLTVTLRGNAPAGVALSFSIVSSSGPASGSLGALVNGSEVPQRTATTLYTPATDFTGTDAFQFQACGVIGGTPVCDVGDVTLTVVPPPSEPGELAADQTVETFTGRAVQIGLAGSQSAAASAVASTRRRITGKAVVTGGAAICGNVADADDDGLGDNHNVLPGTAPVFVSAAVGQSGGGAGSNGTVRIEIEWDVSSLAGAGTITAASVLLNTHRCTIDSLDTSFFAAAGGNGTLEDADYQTAATAVPGAVMPVPSTIELPVGADGTFSFDVTSSLASAVASDATFYTVQGRVDEGQAGPARGLEVRSSATSNLFSFLEPQLTVDTATSSSTVTYEILSLPAVGALRDSLGAPITDVPTTLPSSRVSYLPPVGFLGTVSFGFRATAGPTSDVGLITVSVVPGQCDRDPSFCDDGRDGG
jgi:hypothetical protein